MKRKCRTHSAEFKAQVGVEALKGVKTVSEIAREHEVHPVPVTQWKKERQERRPEVCGRKPTFDEPGLRLTERPARNPC